MAMFIHEFPWRQISFANFDGARPKELPPVETLVDTIALHTHTHSLSLYISIVNIYIIIHYIYNYNDVYICVCMYILVWWHIYCIHANISDSRGATSSQASAEKALQAVLSEMPHVLPFEVPLEEVEKLGLFLDVIPIYPN